MFSPATYQSRRQTLAQTISGGGLAIIAGNTESPMNCLDNTYPFRQDSNFLYYCGIDRADLVLVIDLDNNQSTLYGDDLSLDYMVWMGQQPTLSELAALAGIDKVAPLSQFLVLKNTYPNSILHYLPPYRAERMELLGQVLGLDYGAVKQGASLALTKAVIAQRSIKTQEEIDQLHLAVNATAHMHLCAMKMAKAGLHEAEIVARVEAEALARSGRPAYQVIGTVDGHILHNHHYHNTLRDGQLFLLDAGANAPSYYAGDITRTFPVSGQFSQRQKDIYSIVLEALTRCSNGLRPGVPYKELHLLAAGTIAEGLTALGLMKGDPAEAVAAGAHALFFPHGLGHALGLDVHDMEDLGEEFVGYGEGFERSSQFGLRSLRFAKPLRSGNVLTVEPGLYFIPILIAKWKAEGLHNDFINYAALEDYMDFGGIRIEDNYHITDEGGELLGSPIPKSIEEVEAACS